MARSEYHGKRGSNAGDDFHEIWALRRALETISPKSTVTKVTVEGVSSEDDKGSEGPEWDGVDCAIYHGSSIDNVEKIEIVQLKYSGSSPAMPWTIARLTSSSRTKRNNSIISRLAEAYRAEAKNYPRLAQQHAIEVKLVSNQPASNEIIHLKNSQLTKEKLKPIKDASGLDGEDFRNFIEALDFTELGTIGRHGLEEKMVLEIAAWDQIESIEHVEKFRNFIRNRMKPEGHGAEITSESILSIFGSADPRSLFPCPSEIDQVEGLVQREASQKVIDLWQSGEQRVCLHGQGGEGKTTVLQDITNRLPQNSIVVAFDCYGAGSYLNSDTYRHKPQDAFLQLANEACSSFLLPSLLTQSRDADYPRLFARKVEQASEVLAGLDENALFVVAIDAADNAITAADDAADNSISFVPAFLKLSRPPKNVRFLVSARSGRLERLRLPNAYKTVPLGGFSKQEVGQFFSSQISGQTEDWISQVYDLSGGNPRVLQYAIKAANQNAARVLEYLSPNGQNLTGIFSEILDNAFQKVGSEADVRRLCAALSLLPRPIPINCLAIVGGLSEPHTQDILSDLSPGVMLDQNSVGFRDEDFEAHVRDVGEPFAAMALETAADHFVLTADTDPYSAENAADILLKADRHSAVFALAKQDVSSYPIEDPAVRTMVHEKRMRAAIRMCRRSGDAGEAIKLLLVGADAFRKDAAIRQLLFENLDLAANFSQEQMRRIFLADPSQRARHGNFLMHSIAVSGKQENNLEFGTQRRLLSAWLDNFRDWQNSRQDDDFDDSKWKLEPFDVAALIEGRIRIEGVEAGLSLISRARPSSFRQSVFRRFIERLARVGDYETLSKFLTLLPRRYPGRGLSQVFLALAGEEFDLPALLYDIERHIPAIPSLYAEAENSYDDEGFALDSLELIITATEIALFHGASKTRIRRILSAICSKKIRLKVRFDTHPNAVNSLVLRAFVLLRMLKNGDVAASDFIHIPAVRGRSKKAMQEKRERDEQIQKATKRISGLVPAYKARANIFLNNIDPSCAVKSLKDSVKPKGDAWTRSQDHSGLRSCDHYLARSLLVLGADVRIPAKDVLEIAISLFRQHEFPAINAASHLLRFAQFLPKASPLVREKIREAYAFWRDEKMPSYDKIELVTRYSRIALFQSQKVASEGFDLAIEIASEIDAESIHALAICDTLARHSSKRLTPQMAISAARDLTAISQDAGERIGSNDGFPWQEIGNCLANLSVSQALATCARFNEIGLVNLDILLEPIIRTSLESGEIDINTALALDAVLESPSGSMLKNLSDLVDSSVDECSEYVAWEAFFRKPSEIGQIAESITGRGKESTPLGSALLLTADYLKSIPDTNTRSSTLNHPTRQQDVMSFDWLKIGSDQDLVDAIDDIVSNAPERSYTTNDAVLSVALKLLPDHRRVEILTYLTSSPSQFGLSYQLGEFLNRWLEEWSSSPAVGRWCRDNLLSVISNNLPEIARYLEMGQSRLQSLLEITGANDEKIVDALLTGIEQSIDDLHSALVYHLAVEIGVRTSAEECASALREHISRRFDRLQPIDRVIPNMGDVPDDNAKGIAKFLFANLGNPVVPLRWRTAHAVRRLAKLKQTQILRELVGCYHKKLDHSFGHPVAPPYILSSRLWLLIAFARSAWESPEAVKPHIDWLFDIGESATFPHVLIRAFAQSALNGLAANPACHISSFDKERISKINAPSVPKQKRSKNHSYSTFEKYGTDHTKGRRFKFDTMDTLPYLYNRAVGGFVNPNASKFLDIAEHWIVDEWKAPERAYEIDALRKGSNLWQKRGLSSSTSHGSQPSIESYRTYLEFHGMHCAVGEFLTTEPLTKDADEWDRFENWLKRQGLTASPMWLSDLRGPKPLELQFWRKPSGDKDWLKKRTTDDVKRELMLDDPDWLVLAGDHWAGNDSVRSTVRVESCLVDGETATSLRRTLEAAESSFNYRLAIGDEGGINSSDYGINGGQFRLRSILSDRNTESGIDEHDRFRGELGTISIVPRRWVLKQLNLKRCESGFPKWLDRNGNIGLIDQSWSDEANYYDQTDFQYRVHGHRLFIKREKLLELLNETGMDLIIELTIRRSIGDRYRQTGVEEEETEYDRLFIFRQNGKIEATGKRFRSWCSH